MFIDRLVAKGSESIKCIEFGSTDIERHPAVAEVLRLYGEA